MKKTVSFDAGHDCIKFECKFDSDRCKPGEGGSHGVHGLTIRFYLKGEEGAVQFVLYTGWMPQHHEKDRIGYRNLDLDTKFPAMPADLGYHSKKPMYEGQEPLQDSCELTDGEPCYYDGSGLNANDAMYALVNGGEDALWEFLESYYQCVFADGKYPVPAEYPKARRG